MPELQAMYDEWPFFQSMIDLAEMIVAKADMQVAQLYEDVLVEDEKEKALGRHLRTLFNKTVTALLKVLLSSIFLPPSSLSLAEESSPKCAAGAEEAWRSRLHRFTLKVSQ